MSLPYARCHIPSVRTRCICHYPILAVTFLLCVHVAYVITLCKYAEQVTVVVTLLGLPLHMID